MKAAVTTLALVACFCSTAPFAFSQWTSVAPGIDYRQYTLAAPDPAPNNVFVTRMDRSNSSCIIDSTIAQGQLRSGRETVPGMATRYEDTINYWGQSWGQRSHIVAAINGDGYQFSGTGPTNGQVISGWQAWRWPEYAGGSGFCFKLDRTCFLGGNVRNGNVSGFQFQFVFFANGSNVVPTGVNTARAGTGNELIVYTTQFADNTYTDNTGTEVLVEMTRPLVELPVGGPDYVYGTIKQIRQNAGSTSIPFDHVVLSGTGAYAATLAANCVVGDQIRFQFETHDYGTTGQVPTGPSDWTKAYASIGCFAYVVKNGIVPSNDWAGNSGALIRNPRTSVAFNDNYIYFVVCDGRSAQSVGMTYTELGTFLVNYLGAQWATNEDGGGSSTLWVNGQVKNVPSDGSPRAVANGLLMVTVQPKVQTTTFVVAQRVTTNTSANVRLGPGTNYGILTTVASGTQGQIVSQSLNGVQAKGYNWWKVDFAGTVGWVAESLLIGGGIGPTITLQPTSQTIAVGATATFTTAASGDAPLSYQWQKNQTNLGNGGHYSGVTTNTLTVSTADINDVANYRCVVTNAYGTATSNEAALTLSGKPTITQQPAPQNICTGGTATFTVAASGVGTLTYQWQKNSANLSDGGHYAGVTATTLTVSNADTSDAGSYRCAVTNAAGTTNSNGAALTINAVYSLTGIGILPGGAGSNITGITADGLVVAGDSNGKAIIWSFANGMKDLGAAGPATSGGITTFNSQLVVGVNDNGVPKQWTGNAAAVGTFTTLPQYSGKNWNIYCVAADADPVNGRIYMGGDFFLQQNSGTNVYQNCRYKSATGGGYSSTGMTTYDVKSQTGSGNQTSQCLGVAPGGKFVGRHQLGAMTPSGSRQACVFFAYPTSSPNTTLALTNLMSGSPSTSDEAFALAISANQTVVVGWSKYPGGPGGYRKACLWSGTNWGTCTAIPFLTGDDYAEAKAVSSDGALIGGYGSVGGSNKHAFIWDATNGTRDLQTLLTTQYGIDTTGWTLQEVRAISSDGKVIAGVGSHNGVTEGWVVLMGTLAQAPTITQQPSPQTVCPTASATFTVAATGQGNVAYQWQKDGGNITNGGHYAGATTATLTLSNVDAGDAGSYGCVVSVGCAATTSNAAALTVKAATTITQQPADQDVFAGTTAQFTVTASGEGTLSYQWQKNGVDLSNGGHYSDVTTATLTISTTDSGDVAAYRCVVSAGCGTATSNEAALTLKTGVAADLDHDGDVDLSDFSLFQACFNGPNRPAASACTTPAADLDADGDVDLTDFAIFQGCFNGPNRPPSCSTP